MSDYKNVVGFFAIDTYYKETLEQVKELELQVNSYVGRDDEYDELKLKLEFKKGELNAFKIVEEHLGLILKDL